MLNSHSLIEYYFWESFGREEIRQWKYDNVKDINLSYSNLPKCQDVAVERFSQEKILFTSGNKLLYFSYFGRQIHNVIINDSENFFYIENLSDLNKQKMLSSSSFLA